ncbi:type VI secretion protein [Sphingomonas sp. ABOLG]|jgi:conjugal transfer pilin signal peptidase TrbI|uniref:S26 family signal peptidase n=1 Tax=Sphingomonas sp. ABOLG TaxID=1985880 RepID=UPI000F7DFDE2|nr:S26 family signal peptidase [Sphingomonas sp. ABOLG]RSV16221.1 type VI secretion protein [Sphingomonas sp. ABOLG]
MASRTEGVLQGELFVLPTSTNRASGDGQPSLGRKRLRQWGAVALLAFVMASYNAISGWRENHAFMINASESLPNWAFFVEKGKSAAKGEYVFFVPPDNALVRRHFGPDSGPFGKRVIGMPGDVVAHDGSWVSVNGVRVAHMKPRSRDGEVLTPGPVGRIPDGCFYVGTPHPDGFDSRYAEIGFACRKQLLGSGTPIL